MLNGDAGNRPGMVSNFFKRIARHFANEMAVVTPNGELLSASLEDGLRKWKALPAEERKSLADLGAYDASKDPAPPEGGLTLRIYSRALERAESGALRIYKTKVTRSWEPGREYLWLTAEEARSMVPAPAAKGSSVTAADAIVERIARHALIDLVRVGGNGGPRRPEQVLERTLRVTVEEATPESVRLSLEGTVRVTTADPGSGARGREPKVDEYRLAGEAVFEPTKARYSRFDLTAFSGTGHYDEVHQKVLPLAFAFEVPRGDAPIDRLPPSGYSGAYFSPTSRRP